MKKYYKQIISILFILVISASCLVPAYAYIPFNPYIYNFFGETIATPSGYVPEAVLESADLGLENAIFNPNELYVSAKEEIYMLDQGGPNTVGRLAIFDKNFKLIKEFVSLKNPDGTEHIMKNPSGLTVDKDNNIYICDTNNAVVLKINQQGEILLKYFQPPDDVFNIETTTFQPIKLIVGKEGAAYVVSRGCLEGILEYAADGTFIRYFGAPRVQLSLTDMVSVYWRRIYRVFGGKDVDKSFPTFVPTEFNNLDIDDDGFIYTSIISNERSIDEISKLNFNGTNVLNPTKKSTKKISDSLSRNYGDLNVIAGVDGDNQFADITVDKNGFFSIVDEKLSKIFEYDMEGNLVFIYSGKGWQKGTQQVPVALAKLDDRTIVIDRTMCNITVYKLSDYGEELHTAILLYNKGLYEEAEPHWLNVLKRNANSELGHIGLGKVYMLQDKYKEAMNEFKLANDRGNYSTAFELYRKNLISDNFGWFASIFAFIIVLIVIWRFFGDKIKEAIKNKRTGGVIID